MNIPAATSIASAALTVAVVAGVVAWDVGSLPLGRILSGAALLLFVAVEGRRLVRGGLIMLAVCTTATVAALAFLPDGPAVLSRGLTDAAFIVALFASLSLLRDAAETSTLVQRSGEWMVSQPPGRRYLVLSIGSHLISLVLNFGVLPLLGTMVMKGNTLEAAGGNERIAEIRKQRMMTAVLRGYCLMTVWSPLSVSFAVTQVAVPGVAWWRLLPLQIGLASLLMGLGWYLDRQAFRRLIIAPRPRGVTNGRPAVGLLILIATVVAASVAWAETLGVRPVVGAMMVVPTAALFWLTAQQRAAGPLAAPLLASLRLANRLTISMPAFRNEFVILGGAMYFGRVATAFLSPATTAHVISLLPLPPVLVSVLLAWSMMGLARYGVPQIVTVTLLGSAVVNLTQLGIDPLVLASGFMGAWALSATTTPIGAAALTVARLSGVTSDTVARQWNGRFVLCGALLMGLWMVLLGWVV